MREQDPSSNGGSVFESEVDTEFILFTRDVIEPNQSFDDSYDEAIGFTDETYDFSGEEEVTSEDVLEPIPSSFGNTFDDYFDDSNTEESGAEVSNGLDDDSDDLREGRLIENKTGDTIVPIPSGFGNTFDDYFNDGTDGVESFEPSLADVGLKSGGFTGGFTGTGKTTSFGGFIGTKGTDLGANSGSLAETEGTDFGTSLGGFSGSEGTDLRPSAGEFTEGGFQPSLAFGSNELRTGKELDSISDYGSPVTCSPKTESKCWTVKEQQCSLVEKMECRSGPELLVECYV